MNILAIETSCDETSCSIVKDGVHELSTTTATSAEMHELTGGVVPEVAARKQVESIVPVIEDCIKKSNITAPEEIDAIAITCGPGLIGSLIVGIEAAKALSLVWKKPLIAVNHLVGHIYGSFINNPRVEEIKFPAVVLIVSGGHTDLILMKDHMHFEFLGGTLDDAAGEAFDKVARVLGISKYLGGVVLSKLASTCTHNSLVGKLPRPMLDRDNYDFSFSGLKTAIRNYSDSDNAALACEFENAVIDVLVAKTIRAAKEYQVSSIILGGGVSANTQLRARIDVEAAVLGVNNFYPDIKYCGDSAAYIASAAFFNRCYVSGFDVQPQPSLSIMDTYPKVIHSHK